MAETDITGAFGSVKSEKSYVSSRLDVKSARTKLFDANRELILAQRAFSDISSTDTANYQKAADAVKAAQSKVDEAKQEVTRIESVARYDYKRAKVRIGKQKRVAEEKKIDKEISSLQTSLQRAKDSGQSTAIIDAQIRDLTDKKNKTGKYAPQKDTPTGGAVGDQGTGAVGRNYLAEMSNAFKVVDGMSPKDRQLLATNLKAANYYTGPITGIYTDALALAYQNAIRENSARSTNLGREISWEQFLSDKIAETNLTGAGGTSISEARSISTKLEAASRIEDIFKSELGRMPTPEEIDKYSEKLIAREKKQSSSIRTVTKKVGGVTVTETTGGLDRNQFLQNLVRKLPEYDKRKSEARSLTIQSLQGVANDNGITLSPQQLEQYALEVQNGKDVKVIQSQIRALAGLGMPDSVKKLLAEGTDLSTVYSPYKKAMAAVLEINPETISLSDPVLRSAIGPNGEMSLYEYQRALRKDPRWQYTNNAREDVSTAALQVLRDFGFQG
jgi:hypothetical protein